MPSNPAKRSPVRRDPYAPNDSSGAPASKGSGDGYDSYTPADTADTPSMKKKAKPEGGGPDFYPPFD